jgi:hypothetical protein
VLAAAVGAGADPARSPETGREKAEQAVAAVVHGPVMYGSLNDIYGLRRSSGGGGRLVHDLLRGSVSGLLVDRRGSLVANLGHVAGLTDDLHLGIVVGHDVCVMKGKRGEGLQAGESLGESGARRGLRQEGGGRGEGALFSPSPTQPNMCWRTAKE